MRVVSLFLDRVGGVADLGCGRIFVILQETLPKDMTHLFLSADEEE